MPCLSGRFDPGIGPLINVGILKPGTITPSTPPTGQIAAFPALIDTGATSTCISPAIAQSVGLQPIGLRPMVSATHAVPVNVYLADLILPFGSAGLVMAGIQLMEFIPQGGAPFQILVGRDIICRGTLTLSFDGHFTFSL